jgi:Zn-dependent protease with chaperone function
MNFFQRQQDVRKSSRRLVILFVLAVIALVAVVDLVVFLLFVWLLDGGTVPGSFLWPALAWVSGGTIVAIGLTSLVRTLMLRSGGGGKVARSLGGMLVPENTPDPRLRRLRNVVEEMAIASGTPVPEVYVLPNESGINAFAAGFTPADAAIAVTHGTLERLNRDELQGVIAHEFSHVVNGDMRLNIRLMGVLSGILVLSIIGRLMLHVRGRTPLPIIGIALIILGYIGVVVGRMIKAAVSRQREYLADASAVQFTRQTAGLTGALKKIGGLETGSKLTNDRTEDVSHMLFGEGFSFSKLFATHPPLEERIRTLDPTFDPRELAALRDRWAAQPPSGLLEDQHLGLAPATGQLPSPESAMPLRPAEVVDAIGSEFVPASPAHQRAGAIIEAIPAMLLDRARDPHLVLPLVFALVLSTDPPVRTKQLDVLSTRFGPAFATAVRDDAAVTATLHPVLRLPLAELAFPVLRRRPRPEQEAVLAAIHAVIQADQRIEVFEYCLSRLLHRELYESMNRTSPWGGRRPTEQTNRAIATLLALLARYGHSGVSGIETATAAYQAGLAVALPGTDLPFHPPQQGAVALEELWPALDGLDGPEKQFLVSAMVTVISHDGVLTVAEIEVLRTVCAILHCPLPPLAETRPEQVSRETPL